MADFLEERFPVAISYGSSFGEEYQVEITETANGNEYRQLIHGIPRMVHDVKLNASYTAEIMDGILDLYHRAYGRFAGFRVKNRVDFSTNGHTSTPTATDQTLSLVSAGIYQLVKRYGDTGKLALGPRTTTSSGPINSSTANATCASAERPSSEPQLPRRAARRSNRTSFGPEALFPFREKADDKESLTSSPMLVFEDLAAVTDCIGRAKSCPPDRKTITCSMPVRSGIVNRMVVPCPATESTSTLPCNFSMVLATMSIPTPRPDTALACSRVENPGWKINWASSALEGRWFGDSKPFSIARFLTAS